MDIYLNVAHRREKQFVLIAKGRPTHERWSRYNTNSMRGLALSLLNQILFMLCAWLHTIKGPLPWPRLLIHRDCKAYRIWGGWDIGGVDHKTILRKLPCHSSLSQHGYVFNHAPKMP